MKREFRKALTAAFRVMRVSGYVAEHSFACCNTCAWTSIPWANVDHCVFYHDQDKADADATGSLYLTWQGDPAFIRAALVQEGLLVDHDGSVATRIRVTMP